MQASNVTNLLFKHLNFRGEEQKVISGNIANIDTPGYKTKKLDFQDELKLSSQQQNIQLNRTNKNHIALEENQQNSSFSISEVQNLDEQNDGNNVNLDSQMSRMSQNSIMFSAIQGSIKKDVLFFKTMIDSSGKN
jgi:flagellar basal-body rod protein FlgB